MNSTIGVKKLKIPKGFVKTGSTKPDLDKKGAVLLLRSGECAVWLPRDKDEWDDQTRWFQTGNDDDIVAYKPLQLPADELVNELRAYLSALDEQEKDPIASHSISKAMMRRRKEALLSSIKLYQDKWPHLPDLDDAERLNG